MTLKCLFEAQVRLHVIFFCVVREITKPPTDLHDLRTCLSTEINRFKSNPFLINRVRTSMRVGA